MKRCILTVVIASLIATFSLSGTTAAEATPEAGMYSVPTMPAVGMVKTARHAVPVELGGMSQSTAFLVSPEYVVTGSHCVQSERVTILFGDEIRVGRPFAEDRTRDWCVLKLDRPLKDVEPLKISRKPGLIRGELLKGFGFGRSVWGMAVLFYDGKSMRGHIVGGMSGGPILDASGEVVAINSWSGPSPFGPCGGNNPCELDEWLIELGIIGK